MSRIQSYNSYTVLDQGGYSKVDVTAATTALGVAGIPQDKSGERANALTLTLTAHASTSGDAIYYTIDGSVPSSTNGLALRDGAVMQLFQDEIRNVRYISADGNSQALRVEYARVA